VYSWRDRRYLIPIVVAGVAALLFLSEVKLRHPFNSSTISRSNATESVQAAAPVAPRLGLNVERVGRALLVAWDKDCHAIRNARHGILYIRDGTQESQLALNTQQLDAGNIKYRPSTQSVTFVLKVYPGEGSISDSVQVAGEVGPGRREQSPGERRDSPETGFAERAMGEPARPSPWAHQPKKYVAQPASPKPPTKQPAVASFTIEPAATPVAKPAGVEPAAPAPQLPAEPTPEAAADPAPELTPFPGAPPAPAKPDQGSRLGRIITKIPLLRRLAKHPQHPENENPLK
jgi:hypothetical protein